MKGFGKVLAIAILSFIQSGLLISLILAMSEKSGYAPHIIGSVLSTFCLMVLFGAVPLLGFGVPVYYALRYFKKDHWIVVAIFGLVPAPILYWLYKDGTILLFALISGFAVSMQTHYPCRYKYSAWIDR